MLVGSIICKEGVLHDGTELKGKFEFQGVDTSSCLYATLKSNGYDGIQLMAGDTEDDNALWERRFDVNLSSVKVQRMFIRDEDGKLIQKYGFNEEFFCRLGALIRYAKHQCKPQHAQGYTGFANASGGYTPEEDTTYDIPDKDGNLLGTVELNYGELKSLHIENQFFKIDVEDDSSLVTPVFGEIKNSIPKGFSFSQRFLGFDLYVSKENDFGSYSDLFQTFNEVVEAHPEKELSWLLEKKYIIVTDDMLDDLCEMFMSWEGYVYNDTETTGLNINFKSRIGQADQCVGQILSIVDGESYYFPMQMKQVPNLCNGDHFFFMEHYMKPILESKKIVGHNIAFDWKVNYIYGINTNFVDDTMAILALTICAEKENFPMSLKESSKILLGHDSLELSDLSRSNTWGESDVTFSDLPAELTRYYACADTDNTRGLKVYADENDLLQKYNAKRIYQIEITFSLAVAYQEFYGHRIDINSLEKLQKELNEGLNENMKKMVDIVGYEFNPNSSPQLIRIMYEELGIPKQISRKTGRPTTDKETLKYLSKLTDIKDQPMYPFVSYLLKYREFEGVRKIISQFDQYATEDGYLFSGVMQYGTTTGRVSINKPNYQSYNDVVKKYVCPRPGYYMADTDYSSVEYRITGNMSGNKMIKEGFYDPDFDYHTYQAARMYGVPYATVTPELRKAAKGFNFGIPYGMGDESLGVRIFGSASKENTAKAKKLHKKYFEGGQEDVEFFFENARDKAISNGYTETYFGRRRYYYRNRFSVPAIRRQAGNAIIQGCEIGSTRVQTKEFGIVKVEDIVFKPLHFWDGEAWTEGQVVYSGKKRLCKVTFNGGQVFECSPDHKFLVRSNKNIERFVRCEDLLSKEHSANPHRVVINQNYTKSDKEYSSDNFYSNYSMTENANNIYVDSLSCDSFGKGVVLGRLMSDGNYLYDTEKLKERVKSVCVMQIVAEHEYSIIPQLEEYMKEWHGTTKYLDVRKDRNQALAHIEVYSKSLTNELQQLDVRHSIHDYIWSDTEMLRGFLRGMFDGDGGISGRTIMLTWGSHYDFEPMCRDVQKALTFFGIRSRFRKYEDRYVIQIRTYDNERFLDVIGFLNQEKQEKARGLSTVHDEHVFGKCLIVEKVEMTDEYVDMYDVCNTERGYYVADGVITHNSAADIYKLAVGRVFLRICKEGYLGKILFPGFIHDELLLEIHNSIDPMKFLKMLREEFEVKIEGWCPLYMGFGFGMSWYEAKKTELAIQLQWELVEKYGENGYPSWQGDGYALCSDIPDIIRDFDVRHVANQITLESAQGKEIKPATNSSLQGVLSADNKLYSKCITKFLTSHGFDGGETPYAEWADNQTAQDILRSNLEEFKAELLKVCIPNYVVKENGDIGFEFLKDNGVSDAGVLDTQVALDIFCKMHNVDRTKVNLLNIDTNVTVQEEEEETSSEYNYSDFDEEDEQLAIDRRVDTLGLYLDTENSMVILKLVPNSYMNYIKSLSNSEGKGYRIRFKDNANHKLYDTQAYLTSEQVQLVQQMYIMYFKSTPVS